MASVISPPDSTSPPATISPSTTISHQKTELPQKTILPSSPIVRHRFTMNQYHDMIDRGIFAEDEPIELIRGEIVRKMPIGNPPRCCRQYLNAPVVKTNSRQRND